MVTLRSLLLPFALSLTVPTLGLHATDERDVIAQ